MDVLRMEPFYSYLTSPSHPQMGVKAKALESDGPRAFARRQRCFRETTNFSINSVCYFPIPHMGVLGFS